MEIFLVEDSTPVRARLAAMLGGIPGATVVGEAAEADAAVREILAARPDVVVLDLGLARGTSGFDVLRAVRPQAPGIDFYVLSNSAADPYRQLAERLARFLRQEPGIRTRARDPLAARRRETVRETPCQP
jgi:DNA-binding NarL/FixJ family response regulator